MLLERFASLLSRLVLCLSLLAATAGFAQDSDAPPPAGSAPTDETVLPPLVPAGESPAQPAPRGEVFPREEKGEGSDTGRFVGRLILQPPAGILAGAVAGVVTAYPVLILALVSCDGGFGSSDGSDCYEGVFYSTTALSASIGASLGVMAVGYLLDGKGRFGATVAGALAVASVGVAITLFTDIDTKDVAVPILVLGPALGATLAYALSDAFFPTPTRAGAPAKKREEQDEYARVLPMVSATRTGGIIGGLVGRF